MSILKNRTVLGLACIVLSLIVCFGLTPMFNGAVKAQVEIVRMVKDVRQGDMITADMVATVKVGGYNLPDSVIRKKDDVIGRYAKSDLHSGDYILSGKLSAAPLTEFAYLHELDGSREAISITIKSFAAGLSGKLEAGDIISIIASDFGDFRTTVAPPELRYVKILAVTDSKGNDKEYRSNSNEERELPSTVTLLVVPRQAIILAELEAKGRIHCTLIYRGTQENSEKFLQIQDEFLNPTDPDETENTAAGTDNAPAPSESQGEPQTNENQQGIEVFLPNGTGVIVGG